MEPSQLGSLKGLIGTKDTRFILVRPLTVKVKAYDLVLSGIAYVSITTERIASPSSQVDVTCPEPPPVRPFI